MGLVFCKSGSQDSGDVYDSITPIVAILQSPEKPIIKPCILRGLPALTLHGLRRSFGTLAEWVECPAGISTQIMGHKPTAIAEKH